MDHLKSWVFGSNLGFENRTFASLGCLIYKHKNFNYLKWSRLLRIWPPFFSGFQMVGTIVEAMVLTIWNLDYSKCILQKVNFLNDLGFRMDGFRISAVFLFQLQFWKRGVKMILWIQIRTKFLENRTKLFENRNKINPSRSVKRSEKEHSQHQAEGSCVRTLAPRVHIFIF